MQFIYKFTCLLSLLSLCACTSLSDFNNLPTVQMSNVNNDLTDRTNPVVSFSYCVKNPLDTSVDVQDIRFTLEVDGVTIDEQSVALNESIDEFGQSCHDFSFKPDVMHSPKAASTLLESIFSKHYNIDADLYFDDEDVLPTHSTVSGILK